jgi:hypothetical protein
MKNIQPYDYNIKLASRPHRKIIFAYLKTKKQNQTAEHRDQAFVKISKPVSVIAMVCSK